MKRKLFFIIALACCLVLAVGILAACNESGGSGQQTPGGENPGTEIPGDNPGGEDPGDETVSFTVTFDTQGGSALADITVENGQVIGEFTLPTKQCSRLVGFALDTAGEQMWNVLTDTVSANITLYAIWEDAHTWGEWADNTPATCTENGERTRECEVCGATESEVIPAAHTWGEWTETIAPDCETNGERSHSCEVCGKTESETIDALGHDYSEEYTEDIAPTCENPGSESRHCSRCDATTDSREVAALGHDTSDVEWGYDLEKHWKICGRCNNKTEIAAHDFGTAEICVCGAAKETPISEFTFASLGSNEWEIAKYNGTRPIVMIPSEYEGGTVTSIGSAAFEGYTDLTFVTIPDSVTSIGSYAFRDCTGLKSITIPDSVTSIGDEAFSGCTELTEINWNAVAVNDFTKDSGIFNKAGAFGDGISVTFGERVVSIPAYLFYVSINSSNSSNWPKVSSVTVGKNVARIGVSSFSHCSDLDYVYIGDLATWCVISFGSYSANPLYWAHNLYLNGEHVVDLVIPSGITIIRDYVFYGCSSLMSVTIPGSVTSIGGSAFSGCTGLTSVTIGNGVTSIGGSSFSGCNGLTSIIVPDSVTSIGEGAFRGCSSLENITIPFVGANAIATTASDSTPFGYIFGNLSYAGGISVAQYRYININNTGSNQLVYYYIPSSLRSVTVTDGNILYGAFSNCSMLSSITIPDSVTGIGTYSFYNCTGLTFVNIPDSVISVGAYSFYNCSGLAAITIPDSVTSIESYAFEGCTGLTSVTIGNGVTSIGGRAFYGCSGLTSITIPDSVTSIGGVVFGACSSLESITIPFVGTSATATTASEATLFGLFFGTSSYDGGTAVKQSYRGSMYPIKYYIPSSLRCLTVTGGNLLYGAINGCSMVTSITIGNGVASIGDYAFA